MPLKLKCVHLSTAEFIIFIISQNCTSLDLTLTGSFVHFQNNLEAPGAPSPEKGGFCRGPLPITRFGDQVVAQSWAQLFLHWPNVLVNLTRGDEGI